MAEDDLHPQLRQDVEKEASAGEWGLYGAGGSLGLMGHGRAVLGLRSSIIGNDNPSLR
jgi:hypothetical protein